MPVLNGIIEFVAVSSYRFGGRMKLTPLLGEWTIQIEPHIHSRTIRIVMMMIINVESQRFFLLFLPRW